MRMPLAHDAPRLCEPVSVHGVAMDARANSFDRVHDQLQQATDDRLEKARVVCIVMPRQGTCADHASVKSTLRATVTRHTSSI